MWPHHHHWIPVFGVNNPAFDPAAHMAVAQPAGAPAAANEITVNILNTLQHHQQLIQQAVAAEADPYHGYGRFEGETDGEWSSRLAHAVGLATASWAAVVASILADGGLDPALWAWMDSYYRASTRAQLAFQYAFGPHLLEVHVPALHAQPEDPGDVHVIVAGDTFEFPIVIDHEVGDTYDNPIDLT